MGSLGCRLSNIGDWTEGTTTKHLSLESDVKKLTFQARSSVHIVNNTFDMIKPAHRTYGNVDLKKLLPPLPHYTG